MRYPMIAAASIIGLLVFTGCTAHTPTAPAAAPPNPIGFGAIVEPIASSVMSFGDCLSGSLVAPCFSARRAHTRTVTASAATAPNAPMNLVASSSGSSVTLSWSASSGGDTVTSYIIEAGSAPTLANLANFSTGNATTIFQASGVGAGTYYVRIRAANAAGTSAPSNEAILVVSGTPGVAPGAPSSLTITVNAGGTVGFSWNAASGSPTSYVIEAGSQSGLANLANSDLGSAATAMTATGVGAGTYYVRVRAKNAFGISAPSNEVVLVVGSLGCNPNDHSATFDIYSAYVTIMPVGASAGKRVTFLFERASYSDVAFQGRYADPEGGAGFVNPAYLYPAHFEPRISFGFVPDGRRVDIDGVVFFGEPSVCSGSRVLELSGEVHMGYAGSRACQPGETCVLGWHLRGPGYSITLTRQ
jgi:fibronectin type III domain protein